LSTSITALELHHVSKRFPGVLALQDITWSVLAGEVHALLGENGAGKSTLTKIIGGVYPPDKGTLLLFGEPQRFDSPHDAQKAGIGILYQELNLLPDLSIAENIFLGSEPQQYGLPVIDWKEMHRQTAELLARIGMTLPTETKVGALSVAQQQMVQVVKALHHHARLIVMDEPTTRLTEYETRDLFGVIQALKREGVTVIFISHRLEEIKQICDRVTILRDGCVVETLDVAATSLEKMTTLMLGHYLSERFPRRQAQIGEELLRVQGLTRYGIFEDVDFTLHSGEILGITGIVGSGRTALLRSIFGIDAVDEGQFYVRRSLVQMHTPQDAIACGIGLLTEDRQRQGLVLEMGVSENISLASLENEPPGMLLDHAHEAEVATYFVKQLRINVPQIDFKTRYLSGGTQQKVAISKWLATGPHILLCDEPTQGIDVGAKTEIYRLMNELVESGIGIVMSSADIMEILGMCDRLLILRNGRIIRTLRRNEADEATVLAYATGGLSGD
jgi:ribose transport system ATP-binding protein